MYLKLWFLVLSGACCKSCFVTKSCSESSYICVIMLFFLKTTELFQTHIHDCEQLVVESCSTSHWIIYLMFYQYVLSFQWPADANSRPYSCKFVKSSGLQANQFSDALISANLVTNRKKIDIAKGFWKGYLRNWNSKKFVNWFAK